MTVPPAPSLEWTFEVEADLGPLEDHGLTRTGHRRIIPVVGGTVRGAFESRTLPGGADWQLVRPIESEPARPEFERSLFVASYVREAHRVRCVAYRVS